MRTFAGVAAITFVVSLSADVLVASESDWPVYRHDTRLTGTTLGKGNIERPSVKWQHYLGVPAKEIATSNHTEPWRHDLDSDGQLERLAVDGTRLRVTDLDGVLLWEYTFPESLNSGLIRIANLLPSQKGKQVVAFTSRMDNGLGQGYCFSFSEGVSRGRLAWKTDPLTGQHSPTLVIDDIDGDQLPEVITAPHYRVQIFNGQTGDLKAEVPWKVGRNYGILLTRPRRDQRQKDIFIVCDFVLHVDCIGFRNGKWRHVWGHRYFDENAPAPRGREQYLRVGPRPVVDLDGDDHDEMIYTLIDATKDDQWHLRIRDCESGEVRVNVPGAWLWSVVDMDDDGVAEIVYTPTVEKRPRTYCDLHIGRLDSDRIVDMAVHRDVKPIVTNTTLPATSHTIADEGRHDLLQTDMDEDGRCEIYFARKSEHGNYDDSLLAVETSLADTRHRSQLETSGSHARQSVGDAADSPRFGERDDGASQTGRGVETKWQFHRPGKRLNLVHAGLDSKGITNIRVHDLTTRQWFSFDHHGQVVTQGELGTLGGFTTTPIVIDLDGDGRNEIVLQNAAHEIVVLQVPERPSEPFQRLWSVAGVAMNRQPGYSRNGQLCPQAADLDGDGHPEVLFAAEDEQGHTSLVCVDGTGTTLWRHSFAGCPWSGLQAGVNFWTFGRFTDRPSGLDVYVDLHRRSKGSSEGCVLRGDSGVLVWQQKGLIAKGSAMPFGGNLPSVADANGDRCDDLIQASWTIYCAISGDTGEALFPPAVLNSKSYFGRWIAYASPTVADLTRDGHPDVYLNSASYARGGYAAVRINGKPLWVEFHDNDEGSNGYGPVGDFDGDGRSEIGVPVLNATLLCLNAEDGSHKWRINASVDGDVVAGDINGDGVMELVFSGNDGHLRAVSGKDGHDVWSIAASGRPVIADVTGDGLVEVLAVGSDGNLRVIGQSSP